MSGGCAENSWDGSYCPQKRLPRWSQFPVLVKPCPRRNNVPLCLHCWSHLVIFIESGMVVGVRSMSDPGQQKPWMLCSQGASPGDKSLACRQHAIVTHSRRDQECQWGLLRWNFTRWHLGLPAFISGVFPLTDFICIFPLGHILAQIQVCPEFWNLPSSLLPPRWAWESPV